MSDARLRPAVFLDRDNTLIHDPGYLRDPAQVRLLEGVAEALARLRAVGYLLVVVSNQSGVARGLLTERDVAAVNDRMNEVLRMAGAAVDGIYTCPYLDGAEAVVSAYRRDSELRKPRPGMLLLAARELGIDLAGSWIIGDSERDVEAGRSAGCRAILLSAAGDVNPRAELVAPSLPAAAAYIAGNARIGIEGRSNPED